MADLTPEEKAELDWSRGNRAAWLAMLMRCVGELGYKSTEAEHASWILEREDAVRALRSICEEHGDNEWPSNLALGDVIEKHLGRHLKEFQSAAIALEAHGGEVCIDGSWGDARVYIADDVDKILDPLKGRFGRQSDE